MVLILTLALTLALILVLILALILVLALVLILIRFPVPASSLSRSPRAGARLFVARLEWLAALALVLLGCGGKVTHRPSSDDEVSQAPPAEPVFGPNDEGEPLPEVPMVDPDEAQAEPGAVATSQPPEPASDADAELAEPGMACERDADCSTDFCDKGVCWASDASIVRVGQTGAVYAAGHGVSCDEATPCEPYVCKDGRCRYR